MFFMAFENSVCLDYVSEIYWDSVRNKAIPVVMVQDFNRDLLIPGSYINAFDFESPMKLGLYLDKVSKDISEYAKYFKWVDEYSIIENEMKLDICSILNMVYNDPYKGTNYEVYNIIDKMDTCMNDTEIRKLLYRKKF